MARKPRIQIPVHVLVYTIGFIPGCAYAYHWYKNAPSDEEMEEELRKNYSHNIENNRDKHQQMNAFLQSMKDPNSEQQKKMSEVLLGGRGQQKRHYAVDETIYGTEEGAKLQQEAQEKAKKKKKRKKKKKSSDVVEADKDSGNVGERELSDGQKESTIGVNVKQSAAAVAVVGALAAGATFFLGGRRSQ